MPSKVDHGNSKGPLLLKSARIERECIYFEIVNTSDSSLHIIDKVSPKFGIFSVEFLAEGKLVEKTSAATDFEVSPDDILEVSPKESIVRSIKLSDLPKVHATELRIHYCVAEDSFFIVPWLKGFHTDKGKGYEKKLSVVKKTWIGESYSDVIKSESARPKESQNPPAEGDGAGGKSRATPESPQPVTPKDRDNGDEEKPQPTQDPKPPPAPK